MRGIIQSILLSLSFVLAAAAVAQPARAPGRPVVAIYEMRDLANTGQAASFSTMIQTAITSTNKFRVMERNFAVLRAEQEHGNSGMVTTNTPGRRGGFEGADFLVYGTITNASAQRAGDTGTSIGANLVRGLLGNHQTVSCSRQVATLAIDIRIVDQRTGEVRYATRINQSSQSAASCSGDAQMDLTALFRSAADSIASGLVTTIFPIQIAAVQSDGTIVLNYGEGTLAPGAILSVYTQGPAIIDPATGERLTDEGTTIGQIRVTEVTPRFSRAVPVAPFASSPPVGAIARPAPLAAAARETGRRRR